MKIPEILPDSKGPSPEIRFGGKCINVCSGLTGEI
jgi:hypothetical protein